MEEKKVVMKYEPLEFHIFSSIISIDSTYPADIAVSPIRPIQLRAVRTLMAYEKLTKVISIVSEMKRTRWRDSDHLAPM